MLRCCGKPVVRRAKTASVVNNIALVNTFIISPFRSKDMESKSIVEIHFSRYSLPYFLISAMLNSISLAFRLRRKQMFEIQETMSANIMSFFSSVKDDVWHDQA